MDKQYVMVSGLPDPMSEEIARQVMQSPDMELLDVSLRKKASEDSFAEIEGRDIKLCSKEELDLPLWILSGFSPKLMVIDASDPSSSEDNALFYSAAGVPFVMRTSGDKVNLIADTVFGTGSSALIMTDMLKQTAAFRRYMRAVADDSPGMLDSCNLKVYTRGVNSNYGVEETVESLVREIFPALGVSSVEIYPTLEEAKEGISHSLHYYAVSSKINPSGIDEFAATLKDFLRYDTEGVFRKGFTGGFPPGGSNLARLCETFGMDFMGKVEHSAYNGNGIDFSLIHKPGRSVIFLHQNVGRESYAESAVDAARWLSGNSIPGAFYTMEDMLEEESISYRDLELENEIRWAQSLYEIPALR